MPRGRAKIDQGDCYAVDGKCGREAKVRGLCTGHYGRLRAGETIDTPLRHRAPNGTRSAPGTTGTGVKRRKSASERRSTLQIPAMAPFKDQQVAIDKLRHSTGRLVGDSMGVGKTVTGIGLDFAMREDNPRHQEGPTLIICEKIGIDVWDYHLRGMGVPIEQILMIDPRDRTEFEAALDHLSKFQGYKPPKMTKKGTLDKRIKYGTKTERPVYRYYICHWDALILIEQLTKKATGSRGYVEWSHVIADEVHLAKNRDAKRTDALKHIKTEFKTGLSGTPADDKPQDLWSVLNWLYPQIWSSYWDYVNNYIEVEDGLTGYKILKGPILSMLPELHRRIAPFYIRRTLLEINPDMPEKTHVRPLEMVEMGKAQRKAYESMKEKAIALIGDVDSGGSFTLMAPAVIAVLTRLQQMAAATLAPEWNISDLEDEDGFDTDWDFPDIVMSTPSPKLDRAMNIIQTQESEPFVVFTQWRAMADMIEEECKRKGISVVKIHGATTSKEARTQKVLDFQEGRARVIVGTIGAMGKSVTLTRANHAIFTDRSWRPEQNKQAEDRLWRRTQTNRVKIIDIETEDSIDQWRRDRIDEKGAWIDQLLDPFAESKVRIDPLKGTALRKSLTEFLAT